MIININKPMNMTSFDIVAIVRSTLKRKYYNKKIKVGHAGTLDPLATGVLVVLTGPDTKIQNEIMSLEKEYYAEVAFGAESTSYDLEEPLTFSDKVLDVETLKKHNYIGEIDQQVPAFSAAKIEGKRLYKMARSGEIDKVDLPIKRIVIKDIILDDIVTESIRGYDVKLPVLKCRVACGSGVYLRSLANDWGKDLGVGGVLTKLIRTRVGTYKVEDSLSLDEIENL
jgi:tRNA pseudouridine55 synthase